MAKKKWTKAERAFFADRMRKAKAEKSKKKSKPKSRKSVSAKREKQNVVQIVREVPVMAKRKSSARKEPAVSSKKGRSRSSGKSFFPMGKMNVFDQLQSGGVMVSGGLLAAFLANKLPIKNPTLRSISPAILGLVLAASMGQRNPLAKQAAMGAIVVGGISALKSQFPNLPLLAGESEMILDPSLLGYSGAVRELGAMRELGADVYVSPATI